MLRTMPRFAFVLSLLVLIGFIFSGCAKVPSPSDLEEIQDFRMDTYLRLLATPLENSQIREIRGELARLETLFNRFSPESDISRINLQAGQWVSVDERTIELLEQAKSLAEGTGGYYDPTIGPLVELWQIGPATGDDFEKQWTPPLPEAVAQKRELVSYQGLEIQSTTGQIKLQNEGMGLDVGGIAKGYAVDRLAELLRSWHISHALIDFGGDFYALGQHPEGRPWKLAIRHPRQPEKAIAFASIENQAITTSGDYQRYRLFQGKRFSHLLDPLTGFPPRELASVTIVADSGTVADALSTAVYVLGSDKGKKLIESWPGVEGVIVDQELRIWVSSGLKDKVTFPH